MSQFVLAVDQGTTSTRTMIFDAKGTVVGSAQKEFTQHFPQAAWVEHDPQEIWKTVLETVPAALKDAGIWAGQIAAIGITNQRETTVVWDKNTGTPLYNAIVWQDRRTAAAIDALREHEGLIQCRTGLVLDAYFSASKLQWILSHVPEAKALAQKNALAFGTIDSWLIYKMTQGSHHVTDDSNASRTLLYNLENRDWDPEMLKLFDIPASTLPKIVPSSGVVGTWRIEGHEIPISGIAGDQQAATFGQLALEPGCAKNTYGTGCFLVVPTGSTPVSSKHKLLTTVAWRLANETSYALEGSVFTTGAAIGWLKDGLGIINADTEVNELAASVPNSDGVVFVPAMAGLGSPHWDQYARGSILGITRRTTKAHIARATLEGIALQVCDIVEAASKDINDSLSSLRVDGGAAKSDFLMQLQADLLQIPVIRPAMTELTAKGAAYLAGLAVGFWKSVDDLKNIEDRVTIFEPSMTESDREDLRAWWKKGIEKAKHWATP
jgi:glycerol kinase